KVHNLFLMANALDRIVIAKGETFSFWTQIGQATKKHGYVEGRGINHGRITKAPAPGLNQMANTLFDAALAADCDILEQHAPMPGAACASAPERRIAVAWDYFDLRFKPKRDLMLRVSFEKGVLVVRMSGA